MAHDQLFFAHVTAPAAAPSAVNSDGPTTQAADVAAADAAAAEAHRRASEHASLELDALLGLINEPDASHVTELPHSPRILVATPIAAPSGALSRPTRVSPSASLASQYFPRSDPFNKGGLLRLRGVGYQPSPVGSSPLAPDAPDLYSAAFAHLHQRDLRIIQAMHANAIRLWRLDKSTKAEASRD